MKIIVTLIPLGAVVCGVTSAVYWLRSAFEEAPTIMKPLVRELAVALTKE